MGDPSSGGVISAKGMIQKESHDDKKPKVEERNLTPEELAAKDQLIDVIRCMGVALGIPPQVIEKIVNSESYIIDMGLVRDLVRNQSNQLNIFMEEFLKRQAK